MVLSVGQPFPHARRIFRDSSLSRCASHQQYFWEFETCEDALELRCYITAWNGAKTKGETRGFVQWKYFPEIKCSLKFY
jgi:hypothetical protein